MSQSHVPARRARNGAWKVAYADFATAMMALFIVLWIMNAGAAVKRSVAGYFSDPRGYLHKLGAAPAGLGEGLRVDPDSVSNLQNAIERALRSMPDFDKLADHVKLSVTGEGLRIDLMENEQGLFFATGSPQPTPEAERLLGTLAAQLARMPNTIVVEGHTDSQPFRDARPDQGYSNWDLSTDRANAARRLLCAGGVPPERIVELRGFADRQSLGGVPFEDPRNRRISIVVRLLS